jgi:hypothetical protein
MTIPMFLVGGDLGILTVLKGINVGFLTTSSYVNPFGFCLGSKIFFPAKKAQDKRWELVAGLRLVKCTVQYLT